MTEYIGYDHYGAKNMNIPTLLVPCVLEYDGGPGAVEILCKAKNGHKVWRNVANVTENDYCVFPDFFSALKYQKELGGEISSVKALGYEDYFDLNVNMEKVRLPEDVREVYKISFAQKYGENVFAAAKNEIKETILLFPRETGSDKYVNFAAYADKTAGCSEWHRDISGLSTEQLAEYDHYAPLEGKSLAIAFTVERVAWDEVWVEKELMKKRNDDIER